jgi:hypothetical protein
MKHRCPGPECEAMVPSDMLACSRHWYQVPRQLRTAVYRAWDYGVGAGTPAHIAAMDAAISRMMALPPKGGTRGQR